MNIDLENIEKFLVITDNREIKKAVIANDLLLAMWDFQNHLRSELKYNEKLTDEEHSAIESVRDKYFEILGEYNISIDDLLE